MVIGTYRMTDFRLNTIAPGVIDHSEWTKENGHNNALRINGLGLRAHSSHLSCAKQACPMSATEKIMPWDSFSRANIR